MGGDADLLATRALNAVASSPWTRLATRALGGIRQKHALRAAPGAMGAMGKGVRAVARTHAPLHCLRGASAPQKVDKSSLPPVDTLPDKDGVGMRLTRIEPRVVAALSAGREARHTSTAPVTNGAAIDVPLK